MPSNMDCHHVPGICLEDVKVDHIRNVAAQAIDRGVVMKKNHIVSHNLSVLDITEQQFLNKLSDLVEDRFADDDFSVNNLSREICSSRSQLYRRTRSHTVNSPVEFIRDIKLQKAFFLIQQTARNISGNALEVGINNPSYFSKYFQKKYGITPSQLAV
ncbi:MAG: helix-turn-helix transcriptional regulator [Bacteroidales bacterium]|nr:helix-turn-helix transcriptional regulator [Bacteroidales bacterium]